MKEGNWSTDILEKLIERDKAINENSQCFKAFEQLSQQLQVYHTSEGDSARLSTENVTLRTQNESLVSNLNSSTLNVESLESRIQEDRKTISKLEKAIKNLNRSITNLNLVISEKNKTIEIINDEALTNQIQVNVLSEKLRKLESDNEALLKRWMEKIKMDAEQLNHDNEKSARG